VNNTLNGRYRGLKDRKRQRGEKGEVKNNYVNNVLSSFVHICKSGECVCVPVVHNAGSQVCV
jgi:hypothetical protein